MAPALRLLAVVAAACLAAGPAATDEGVRPPPRQSYPQQLAQSCRMLCMEEFVACQSTCETATSPAFCRHQCQTRFNLCMAGCR